MVKSKQITFRMHGLSHHKDAVDAGVFARKLAAFVKALQGADKNVNGRRCLEFLISDLKMGSATASIVERESSIKHPARASSIADVHSTLVTLYGGRASELNGSASLVPIMMSMCRGVDKAFSHIEIVVDDNEASAVRVDNFFERQIRAATEQLASEQEKAKRRLFRGKSLGTFDGTLKLVDHRGTVKLAKLVLTAGGAEIECAYNEQTAPSITPAFDQRATVQAWAHYDGSSSLPSRLEVLKATPIKKAASLERWKGAFAIPADDGEDW